MESIIVGAIIMAAAGYTVYRLVVRPKSGCGCGCSCDAGSRRVISRAPHEGGGSSCCQGK